MKNKYAISKNSHWVKCLAFIFLIFSVTHVYAAQTVDEILNEYYPKITVNGHDYNYNGSEKKTYHNQVYKIKYEPKKGYQAPENYPMK